MTVICTWAVSSWACLSPGNIVGVAFTAGETLDIAVITGMGTEGVNYFIDGDSVSTGIRYMSHYDPKAMVFVGHYGMSYQQNLPLSCMGVILPLPDTADEYAPIDKASFDFAAAVTAEIRWLVENGVVTLSEKTVHSIDSALSNADNGGSQYWTHAHSVLGYNSWYDHDSVEGTWASGGGGGVNGVSGVDGVKEVRESQSLSGCSVISPDVAVPPSGLNTTAVSFRQRAGCGNAQHFRIHHAGNSALTVRFSSPVRDGQKLSIFNCRGEVLSATKLHAGLKSITIEGLPYGRYFGQLD